jgi:hypothetical protein
MAPPAPPPLVTLDGILQRGLLPDGYTGPAHALISIGFDTP